MPAIIMENSTPNRISIRFDTDYQINTYPVVNLREDDPEAGQAQILPYGVAVWQSERHRLVFPWHRITSLTEHF